LRIAAVALPLPLFRTFSYRVPPEMAASVEVGSRVLVPFGRRERIGWVEAVTEMEDTGGDDGALRDLVGVLDREPSVPGDLLALCRWIGEYYIAPLGQVLRTALPAVLSGSSSDHLELVDWTADLPASLTPLERQLAEWLLNRGEPQRVVTLRRELGDRSWWTAIHSLAERGVLRLVTESPRTRPAVQTRRVVRLEGELPGLIERDRVFARSPRQRECWEVLEALGGRAELAHLTGQLGFSSSVIRGLVAKGLAVAEDEEFSRDPYENIETPTAPALDPTPSQAAVLDRLVAAVRTPEPGTFLLRGVTGRGRRSSTSSCSARSWSDRAARQSCSSPRSR
jgi:primosomal protein N' (replication factor Y) (superfamily II helicase)